MKTPKHEVIKGARQEALNDGAISALLPKVRPDGSRVQSKLFDYGPPKIPGLYIVAEPTGSYLWRFRYRRPATSKENHLSLGAYPAVTIAAARSRAASMYQSVTIGVDPGEQAKRVKEAVIEAVGHTFERVAEAYITTHYDGDSAKGDRTREHQRYFLSLVPSLHKLPIGEITTPLIVVALKQQEARGVGDTAHRVGQFCNRVFRYAKQVGTLLTANPASELRGALKPHRKKHFAAITDPLAFGKLLGAIDAYQGKDNTVQNGLKFLALSMTRPGEARMAEWSEFVGLDGDSPEWRIPARRMKMKRQHLVPLSRQLVAILEAQRAASGSGQYVFPAYRSGRPLSENAFRIALLGMGYTPDVHTAHGFRSSASTIINESGKFEPEVVELQLAHAKKDQIAGIYDRAQKLPVRRQMLQWLADEYDHLREDAASTPRQGSVK